MKNYLLFTLFILIFSGCGEKDLHQLGTNDDDLYGEQIYKEIFEQTGCKVDDASSLLYLYKTVLVDDAGNRYLTGSMDVKGTETFWFSKFKSNGDCVWEKKEAPAAFKGSPTYGLSPVILSNGDVLVSCAVGNSSKISSVSEMLPTILKVNNGSINFIKVKDGYKYSSVKTYKDFFICEISQREMQVDLSAYPWAVQISNDGKILYSASSINSPDESSYFLNTDEYITADKTSIKKNSLSMGEVWKFDLSLPKHNSYQVEIEKKAGDVVVSYKLSMPDGSTKLVRYKLLIESGMDYKIINEVQLDKKTLEIQVADTYKFRPTLLPSDTSTPGLSWKSSDEEIATVSSSGVVTAKKKGQCVITVESKDYSDVSDVCELVVIAPTDNIIINETEVEILETDEYQIEYQLYPVGATHAVVWESENPSIATVDANGKVTALAKGTTRIKGSILNGKRVAECVVNVITIQQYITLTTSFIGSVNGEYVKGQAATGIVNSGSKAVVLSKFIFYSGSTIYSEEILNEVLEPGGVKAFNNIQIPTVQRPSFVWVYKYNGREYKSTYVFKVN